jgi:hypothetical protein
VEWRGACRGLVGKHEGHKPLLRRRLEDNIKMDLQEFGWRSIDWIYFAEDKYRWRVLVCAVVNLWAP